MKAATTRQEATAVRVTGDEQGVRFLVLPQDSRDLRRFPALVKLVAGEAELPGYRREATLAWDVLFVRAPASAP